MSDAMCKTCGIVHKKADADEELMPSGPMSAEDCARIREEARATKCARQLQGCTGQVELVRFRASTGWPARTAPQHHKGSRKLIRDLVVFCDNCWEQFNQKYDSVNATRAAAGMEAMPKNPDFVWLRLEMVDPDCLSIVQIHHG